VSDPVMVELGVSLGPGVSDTVEVSDRVVEGVRVPVPVVVGVRVRETLLVSLTVGETEIELDVVMEELSEIVTVIDAEAEILAPCDKLPVGVDDSEILSEMEGLADTLGIGEGEAVLVRDPVREFDPVDEGEGV